jgi:quinone-modifying oxidoreductase subunit QmoA
MATAKQIRYLRAQHPEADIFVYYIDRRALGRHESFLSEVEQEAKVHYIPGKVARVSVDGTDGKPVLYVEDTALARKIEHKVDLVVLAAGMVPETSTQPLARDGYGFLCRESAPAGHVPAGSACGPVDVASTVRDATRAVLRALGQSRVGA